MYVYFQLSGKLYLYDTFLVVGYSGFGAAKNDPAQQATPGMGPIPQGVYHIGAESDNHMHGPVALHLDPIIGTNTHGRSGFLVHGDSIEAPGSASHGCIIVPRPVRERMLLGTNKLLVVLSGHY